MFDNITSNKQSKQHNCRVTFLLHQPFSFSGVHEKKPYLYTFFFSLQWNYCRVQEEKKEARCPTESADPNRFVYMIL